MKRVRLIKVLVQPVLIVDDGETLVELDHPAIAIPAEQWSAYSSERFPRELAEFEKQLNGEQ
jgi:hypothetical protein